MVKTKEDLTGRTFGRWLVLGQAEDYIDKNGNHHAMWHCICGCEDATEKDVIQRNLKSGTSQSCGCLHREMMSERFSTHKMTDSRLYLVWKGMKARCYIESHNHYEIYGAKGITVCDEWKNDFQAFYDWAIQNGYDETASRNECTIERKDVNGNYCPENCCFVSATTQCINQNLRKDNKTGTKGVNWDKHRNKWQAQLQINKKKVLNEYFDNFDDAVKARRDAELKYFGEYLHDVSQQQQIKEVV